MKKFYSLLAIAIFAMNVFGQSTIYSENMGNATGTNDISENTFQNGSPITYSGSADVRSTSPSTASAYTGASGGANVLINTNSKNFIISGINTVGYQNIKLFFGQRKGSNAANNEMTVEVSSNGTNWTTLSYTRSTGSGTANWEYVNPTGTIPATANLRLRFAGTNGTEWRIDDVKLTGTSATLATLDIKNQKNVFVKNTSVDNEIFFGVKSLVKIYNVNGQLLKTATVFENESLNISDFQKGIYIVTGTIDNKVVSEKIVKK